MSIVFLDSFGKEVKNGDTIIILKSYNFHLQNNIYATVIWCPNLGQFRWRKKGDKHLTYDFLGIASFSVVEPETTQP